MHAFKVIGLLDTESSIQPRGWSDLARMSLEKRIGEQIGNDRRSFLSALSTTMTAKRAENTLRALDWLGLAPENAQSALLPSISPKPHAPIELFTSLLAHKLKYNPEERDMVVLSHQVVAQPLLSPAAGATTEVHTSQLIAYGNSEASAMARCVGLPVAFATLEVLRGGIHVRGVHGPTDKTLYGAVLDGLQGAGLEMKESVSKGQGMERVLAEGLRGRRAAY